MRNLLEISLKIVSLTAPYSSFFLLIKVFSKLGPSKSVVVFFFFLLAFSSVRLDVSTDPISSLLFQVTCVRRFARQEDMSTRGCALEVGFNLTSTVILVHRYNSRS